MSTRDGFQPISDCADTIGFMYRTLLRQLVDETRLEDILSQDRQVLIGSLSPDERKKLAESSIFVRFARCSGIVSNPFDHKNDSPPFPDIRTVVSGSTYFFELGEVTDEAIPRRLSRQFKTGGITGGSFSQSEPLLRMFREKCQSHYVTNGAPVDLVLHYSKMYPYAPLITEFFKTRAVEVGSLMKASPFTRIWIYSDWEPRQILWCIARELRVA
jgi:hypothetical protein